MGGLNGAGYCVVSYGGWMLEEEWTGRAPPSRPNIKAEKQTSRNRKEGKTVLASRSSVVSRGGSLIPSGCRVSGPLSRRVGSWEAGRGGGAGRVEESRRASREVRDGGTFERGGGIQDRVWHILYISSIRRQEQAGLSELL
jgi:hypothetical protein